MIFILYDKYVYFIQINDETMYNMVLNISLHIWKYKYH